MISEIRFRRNHRRERRFENYLWGNGRNGWGKRQEKRLPHKNTRESSWSLWEGCGGYYWKELVSPYLKTKGMLENCVGKQNQGEHAREHAHRGKDEGQGLHQGCKDSENNVHGKLCKHDSLCWNFFSCGNFIMQNTWNLCEHQWCQWWVSLLIVLIW